MELEGFGMLDQQVVRYKPSVMLENVEWMGTKNGIWANYILPTDGIVYIAPNLTHVTFMLLVQFV